MKLTPEWMPYVSKAPKIKLDALAKLSLAGFAARVREGGRFKAEPVLRLGGSQYV